MVGFNDRGEHYAEQLADQQDEDQANWTDAIREQLEGKGREWLEHRLVEVIGADEMNTFVEFGQREPTLTELADEIISEGPGLARLAADLELVNDVPPPAMPW